VRTFHLGDILSVTTGKLIAPGGIGAIYDILNYMTTDNLFTHQIPRACRECSPWLLRQHPQLSEIIVPTLDANTWRAWLDEQVRKYGERLPVDPIPADDHDRKDPIQEVQEMVGKDRVIVVRPPDAE